MRGVMKMAAAVVGAGALHWAERRWPLRGGASGGWRVGRNLVLSAAAGVVVWLCEGPVAGRVARWVERRGVGVVRWVPLPPLARDVVAVVLLDYTLYHWHVATHRVPWLWRWHRVHHLDHHLDSTTAARFHPGEMLLSVPFRAAQIAVVGAGRRAYGWWGAALAVSVAFHHSDLGLPAGLDRALRWVVVTPRLHGIHHDRAVARSDRNYSSGLTVWDRLHGTWRDDVPAREVVIGAPGVAARDGLGTALALPFE